MNKGEHNNDQSQVTQRPPDPAPSISPSEIDALSDELRALRNFIRATLTLKLPEDK